MIDATKLVDYELYHVQYHYGVWTVGRWHASNERFTFIGSTATYSLTELTDAIPIPTPEQLAEMWEVISDVANSAIEHTSTGKYHVMQIDIETHDLARKLLEKRT